MVAYLTKTRGGFDLRIAPRPDGRHHPAVETLRVSGKREARAMCAARGIVPWNF